MLISVNSQSGHLGFHICSNLTGPNIINTTIDVTMCVERLNKHSLNDMYLQTNIITKILEMGPRRIADLPNNFFVEVRTMLNTYDIDINYISSERHFNCRHIFN